MALYDLADSATPLPTQLALDSSLLLALRKGDDNPQAAAARGFIRRLGQWIADRKTVAWLVAPVLQECYHVILSRSLRRSWESLPQAIRPANWLMAYKQRPELLAAGFADLTSFDEILAAIPVTPAQPRDLDTSHMSLPQDALILAEAERLGVTAIATLDSDWRRAIEFDIYTTPI